MDDPDPKTSGREGSPIETASKLSTAQNVVLREIRQAIMSRRLRPGQRIRQWDIADRLNVSSVPVREALKTLEAEGQVTYEPYRGYKVVELSREQLQEIYLAKNLLEAELLRRAVKKIDAQLIRRLEGALSRMEEYAKAGDVLQYTEANCDFHFALFDRAELPRIYHMVKVLWQNSETYRGLIFSPEWCEQAQKDHRILLEACKVRDAASIIEAQEKHNRKALAYIDSYMEGIGTQAREDRGD